MESRRPPSRGPLSAGYAAVSPTRGKGSNTGGRHMQYDEMHQHKLRMKAVRPMVDLSSPWSHAKLQQQQHAAAAGGGSRPDKLRSTVAAASSRPQSAKTGSRPASAAAHRVRAESPSSSRAPAKGDAFDVAALPAADRETYADMLRLLTRLPTAEARAALEQLYRESEDRKLLVTYTGVFPKLDGERA